MTPAELFGQAFRHHQAGQLGDAERLYREALAVDANHVDALHLLGVLFQQTGKAEAGIASMKKALTNDAMQPACLFNLGVALQSLGRLEEALRANSAALLIAPHYADAHNNKGTVLQALGRLEEAVTFYVRALRLKPLYPDAHNNLGSALAQLGRLDGAIAAYRNAVRLKPDYVQAHANLGYALQNRGHLEEAARQYGEAIRLQPDHAEAVAQQLHCLRRACDWRETGRLEQDLLRQTGHYSPFIALLIDSSGEQRLAVAKTWARQHAAIQPLPQKPRSAGPKIRVGYLSADFCNHAVAQLMAELIERHDRKRFEIIGYSYGPDDGSQLRHRLMKGFDRFIDIRALSHLEAARLIQQDQIDILVDLTGYTASGRTEILAHRPAPVQVNFLGYPGTMGTGFIDYIIADSICIPPEDEAFFSEKVVRLPDSYQPNDSQRPVAEATPSRAVCGLPEQGFVFCCFNLSVKITPVQFALWLRLLDKVRGSVLWLLDTNATARDNLRQEASKAGIAPERLVFAPRLPLRDHLARHRLADLFLDTLPYNAHTTASDALWLGLPVLTCKGSSFAGRVAASLLTAAGLEEMITLSPAEYEELAVALANDPVRLAAVKAKLAANRATAPLFDSERFARSIEAAYERMLD